MGNIDNQYQQIGRNIMKESQQEYWDPNTAEEDVWNDAKAFIRGVHDNQFEPKDMFEYGKKKFYHVASMRTKVIVIGMTTKQKQVAQGLVLL